MKTAVKTTRTPTVDVPVKQAPAVKVITTDQFVEMLMHEKGANIISFTHCTSMSKTTKMRKGNNPYFKDCFKSQKAHGMINAWYDKAVERKLAKKGKSVDDFKKGESWHEPIIRADGTLTPFCRHKKDPRKVYLRFILQESKDVKYHTAGGKEIKTEDIKPFLPDRSKYENQGLDEEDVIKFQVWGIDDITGITINKQRYQIVN